MYFQFLKETKGILYNDTYIIILKLNKNMKMPVSFSFVCSTLFDLHKLVLFVVMLVKNSYLE